VLKNIGCKSPVIMVYNKCDKVEEIEKDDNGVYISVKENKGIDKLKEKIIEKVFE
jgi:50S ribosomal subunit-associated GTPase HflX